MKRIIVLCIACVMLMSVVVSAEVSKGKDSFTEGVYVSSFVTAKPFLDRIHFTKIISEGTSTYKLSISRIGSNENIIGDEPIEIKIDGYPVQELKNYRYKRSGPDSYGVLYNSIMDINLSSALINGIKETKRVAIRFRDARGIRYPYTIPDDVVAEWKQVINTTE